MVCSCKYPAGFLLFNDVDMDTDNQDTLQDDLMVKTGDRRQVDNLLVVGIGASAGGIEALQRFFEQVDPRSGMAYAVILHLTPDHDSQLADLLQQVTPIPVTRVMERTRIEADHIYVVPPNQHLVMEDDSIVVIDNTSVEDRRAPVDIFFRTLAESHGPRAVCVVLTGTGANGSMGLKRIKERGGVVFVQSPVEALHNEMPRNAIATGLVDEVLPVALIPEKIHLYKHNLGSVYIPVDGILRQEIQQQALREIFTRLTLLTGQDFSQYKRPAVLRRLERRMQVHNLTGLPAYADLIEKQPEELNGLLKDLLISVTNFFRDKKAFERLEMDVFSKLFYDKTDEEQVRIWVAGCATGEEAYSLAMLCAERTLGKPHPPRIQIFATDIDETVIDKARAGLYTINDAADVSPDRLRRFFQPEGEGFRVRREIRDMILFARHNLVKDPPFYQIDLITCRNLLIYLDRTIQEKVMETFHFSLNNNGHLFLGSSETADSATDLFSTVSAEHHIYQTKPGKTRLSLKPSPAFHASRHLSTRPVTPAQVNHEAVTLHDLHLRLRDEFAPPSVMINERYDILHVSENAGRYLRVAGGESTLNLLRLIREDMLFELRSALYEATRLQKEIEVSGLQTKIDNKTENLTLHVRPVVRPGEKAHGLILVVFKPAAPPEEVLQTGPPGDPLVKRLQDENTRLTAQLRSSNDQHAFQEEELKAFNEELHAMIEELRLAGEELETGKEELQSINEELSAINQELKIRVEESTLANNNLQNLINSTNIGTIFLDRNFRVVLFTPVARHIFNFIPADHGRPISDISSRLEYPHLIRDAEKVLKTLQQTEQEVTTSDGQVFLMRVLPYVAAKGQVDGVVITFVDILERTKESERKLRKIHDRLVQALQAARAGWGEWNWLTGEAEWSTDARKIIGFATEEESRTKEGWLSRIHPADRQRVEDHTARAAADGKDIDVEYRIIHPDGNTRYIRGTGRIGFDEASRPVRSAGLVIDITERWKAEEAQRWSEIQYQTLFDSIDEGFCVIEVLFNRQEQPVDFRYLEVNAAFERQTGIKNAQGRLMREIAPKHEEYWFQIYGKIALTGEPMRFENRAEQLNQVYDVYAFRTGEPEQKKVAVLFNSIKERKRLEQLKDDFISIASHELKTPLTSIRAYAEFLLEEFYRTGDTGSASLLQKLDTQINRLTQLVHDMFDTTQISEGKMNLRLARFDLGELIEEQVAVLQHLSDRHRLVYHPCGPTWVKADRDRIGQVLTNLVANAVKYSPKGGNVTLHCETEEGNKIAVHVQDKGIGIPAEQQEKVFDRFFRINNKNTETLPGIGLGLYITAGIIRRHGGTIRVESKVNEGSVFVFTLATDINIPAVPEAL